MVAGQVRDKMAELDPDFPADFHWHDLRATGASWLIMAGVQERTVMRILNLKSTIVLNRYAHHSMDHLKESGEKIAKNFVTVGADLETKFGKI